MTKFRSLRKPRFLFLSRASLSALVAASALHLSGCAEDATDQADDMDSQVAAEGLPVSTPPPVNTFHSFSTPTVWGPSTFTTPVLHGNLQGNGRESIVRFGQTGVFVERPAGVRAAGTARFLPAQKWTADFSGDRGWDPFKHPRFLGDINGDRKDDIVGFGDDGVWIARNNGAAFEPAIRALTAFGVNAGWNMKDHVRVLADVNGDGKQDIVGFGGAGIWVSRATSTGFEAPVLWLADMGKQQGWNNERHLRFLADVNGDGKEDAVGFGEDGTYVALSTGSSFTTATRWSLSFGPNRGWVVGRNPRMLADVDGDGRLDVVGFTDSDVQVAKSTGTSFSAPARWATGFGYDQGWRPGQDERVVMDLNGDKRADVVGFGPGGVYVALAENDRFVAQPRMDQFSSAQGWIPSMHERFLMNVDGDLLPDIVGYGARYASVSLSGNTPTPIEIGTRADLVSRSSTLTANDTAHLDTEQILGIAIAYPTQFHQAMRYVYGSHYIYPAGDNFRRALVNGDYTVDSLLWTQGGRGETPDELNTIGDLLVPMVVEAGAQPPGDAGGMFAMEITNVARLGQNYQPGVSASLIGMPSGTARGLLDPFRWIARQAEDLYHEISDRIDDAYDWTVERLGELKNKIEDFVEYLHGWGCIISATGVGASCAACIGTGALTAGTEGAAAPAAILSCQACGAAVYAAYTTCRGTDPPVPPSNLPNSFAPFHPSF